MDIQDSTINVSSKIMHNTERETKAIELISKLLKHGNEKSVRELLTSIRKHEGLETITDMTLTNWLYKWEIVEKKPDIYQCSNCENEFENKCPDCNSSKLRLKSKLGLYRMKSSSIIDTKLSVENNILGITTRQIILLLTYASSGYPLGKPMGTMVQGFSINELNSFRWNDRFTHITFTSEQVNQFIDEFVQDNILIGIYHLGELRYVVKEEIFHKFLRQCSRVLNYVIELVELIWISKGNLRGDRLKWYSTIFTPRQITTFFLSIDRDNVKRDKELWKHNIKTTKYLLQIEVKELDNILNEEIEYLNQMTSISKRIPLRDGPYSKYVERLVKFVYPNFIREMKPS